MCCEFLSKPTRLVKKSRHGLLLHAHSLSQLQTLFLVCICLCLDTSCHLDVLLNADTLCVNFLHKAGCLLAELLNLLGDICLKLEPSNLTLVQPAIGFGKCRGSRRYLFTDCGQLVLQIFGEFGQRLHLLGLLVEARLQYSQLTLQVCYLGLHSLDDAGTPPTLCIMCSQLGLKSTGPFLERLNASTLLVQAVLHGIQLQAPSPLLSKHPGFCNTVGRVLVAAASWACCFKQSQLLGLCIQAALQIAKFARQLRLDSSDLLCLQLRCSLQLFYLSSQLSVCRLCDQFAVHTRLGCFV
mmetsp:Transcript_36277/g.91349  ORF Transcript_36277/g.91349 Transcript_36277/m.91349 type:complete len:297 (+) Transcript_36277:819-1709(+)